MSVTFLTDRDKMEMDTVMGHLSEAFVTPQMHGGVGDGEHDDTKAIQDAIDAAQTVGGTVYLPVGKYLVTNTIIVKEGVDVVGTRGAIIYPACDTVFHSLRRTTLRGFYVHVLPEHSAAVNTVFLVDQSSRTSGPDDISIRFNDLQIFNGATEVNNSYTVWDIHSADGVADGTSNEAGFAYVSITHCRAKNNVTMGYSARIYSYKTDWVSSVMIDGCTTGGFRWHWFFMPSEELATSVDYSYHNSNCSITNCCGQWSEDGMAFIYAANANVIRSFNNMPWDWGSSGNDHKAPYLFSESFYREGSLISDLDTIGWANFGIYYEDGTSDYQISGLNWLSRIFRTEAEEPQVRSYFLGGMNKSDTNKVGAFLLWKNASALNATRGNIRFVLMDEYGMHNQVILTRTAAYVDHPSDKYHFAFNANYTCAYIVSDDTSLPRTLFAVSLPVITGKTQRAHSKNSFGQVTGTINVDSLCRDEVYCSTAPDDLVTVPTIVNPNNNIIYSANGTAYQLTVTDDGTLSATAATPTMVYAND